MEICVGSHRIRQKKIPIQGETEADTIGQSATEACPHCKGKSWWQGHAVLPWCDAARGSSAPVNGRRMRRAGCSGWEAAGFGAWDPAICEEGSWPQAAGREISQEFPKIFPPWERNGSGACVHTLGLRQPLVLQDPVRGGDPSPRVTAPGWGWDPAGVGLGTIWLHLVNACWDRGSLDFI